MADPVLYSFRRCPYAMRARLALAISATRCELREVKLAAKPAAMLAASPMGLRMTKEGLAFAIDAPSLEAAMAIENRNQVMCAQSADFQEGMRAFLEKRRPVYSGS
jgi:enoyl-CoA hydratase/carnithine racemase